MIKHSEILTIMIQAFFITTVGFIFVGCWVEFKEDIKNNIKLFKKRKRGRKLREYTCPKCGFGAWALDHIIDTNCYQCGARVKTEPVPEFVGSSVSNEFSKKVRKNKLKFIEK